MMPLAPNPSGAPPDFFDSPSLLPAVLGVGLTMIITSGVLVTVRIFTNLKHAGKLGFDDCMSRSHGLGAFYIRRNTSF